jgi:hypothetical protein
MADKPATDATAATSAPAPDYTSADVAAPAPTAPQAMAAADAPPVPPAGVEPQLSPPEPAPALSEEHFNPDQPGPPDVQRGGGRAA